MKLFAAYLLLQLKRAARLIPRMLAVTLLLAALAALGAAALSRQREPDKSQALLRVGVVGDKGEQLLDDAMAILQSSDSSSFFLRLERLEREEADRLLRRGDLAGYVTIPEGFAQALWYGEHRTLNYTSHAAGADLGAQLTREVVVLISSLALETENAIYGAQNLVEDRLPGADPGSAGDKLLFRYASAILDRDRLYNIEVLGAADSLSLPGYYCCALPLAFLLFWAISCCPFFSRRSRELGQVLHARGLGAIGQVLGEFFAYLLLLAAAALTVGLLAAPFAARLGISVPELEGRSLLSLLPGLLPPVLLLCLQQFLLFELAESAVSAVLLQFLNAAVQGYLAGLFYPSSFFPEGMRRLGSLLPAGVSMGCLRGVLLAKPEPAAALGLLGWTALCSLLILTARSRRNRA